MMTYYIIKVNVGVVQIILIIIMIGIAISIKPLRKYLKEKLQYFKKKMIFNGIIRFIGIGFLAFTFEILVMVTEMRRCPAKATLGTYLATFLMLFSILLYIIYTTVYMIKNKEVL